MAMTEILDIIVKTPGGTEVVHPWSDSAVYVIGDAPDSEPLLRCCGHRPQPADRNLKKLFCEAPEREAREDGTYWVRLGVIGEIARRRRLGYFSIQLKVPKARLQFYVVPHALFGVRDIRRMLLDIEENLEKNVGWAPDEQDGLAYWEFDGSSHELAQDVLSKVAEELAAAVGIRQLLDRDGGGCESPELEAPAEGVLLAYWAGRRSRDLSNLLQRVEHERKPLTVLAAAAESAERSAKLIKVRDHLTDLAARALVLRARANSLPRHVSQNQPFPVGPSVQRDHRARLLLRAFSVPLGKIPTDRPGPTSSYPAVCVNELFELWGAVWLVRQLGALGFRSQLRCRVGETGVVSAGWDLRAGPTLIQVDFEPGAKLLDLSGVPQVLKRAVSGAEWAAVRQVVDEDRPFFSTSTKCTPDYVVRISTPNARHVLIGDACVAHPDHHGRDGANLQTIGETKTRKVQHYVQTFGWLTPDRVVVRAAPLGGFVIFPPPLSSWAHLNPDPMAPDVAVFTPSPCVDSGTPCESLARHFSRFVGKLRAGALRPGELAEGQPEQAS